MIEPAAPRDPLDFARLYAALSGPFQPLEALRGLPENPRDIAATASLLASACDTNPAGATGCWLMRMSERRHELKRLHDAELLEPMIGWRRKFDINPVTSDLHAALLDQPPISCAEIEETLEDGGPRERLERIVVALDWAGDVAPGHSLLPAVRSAIATLDQRERLQRSSDRGFVGRLAERNQVTAWLERPITAPPVTCLYIKGAPSIGKSSVLAEAVCKFHQGRWPLVLRFDFDWASLNVQDQLGFTMEAARQLAQQLGKASIDLLDARLAAAALPGGTPEPNMSWRAQFPTELARRMVQAAGSDRPLLVVLDTLEVLRGRGETHPQRLFAWLDSLVAAGLGPMRVIAAGRGEALDSCPDRVAESVPLDKLDNTAAGELLDWLGVPPADRRDLIKLADGNPLKLRLGAEIFAGGEAAWLRRRKRKKEISAAFLYRCLLSRIGDRDLQRIVNPGLIVRRINAGLIYDVLVPRLRLRGITHERAEALMRELEALHWLVERDPAAPGFLRHRPEMRILLLPLLYGSAPKLCAVINEGASQWFGQRREPWSRAEQAYHQLQLLRMRRSVPDIGWDAAVQISSDMMDELPQAARDLVHMTRGERSGQLRGSGVLQAADAAALTRELLGIVQRQDWREGQNLVARVLDSGTLEPASPEADTIRAFLWRTGRWHSALGLLRERDRHMPGDADLTSLPPPVALARLEMRAEFAPQAFLREFGVDHPITSELYKAAIAASDNIARHGATVFLLSSNPERQPFSGTGAREIDPVGAAHALWADTVSRFALDRALQIGRERSGAYLSTADSLRGVPEHRLLASLTPYAAIAGNLIAAGGRRPLLDHARAVLNNLAGPYRNRAGVVSSGDPLPHITGLGVFAEWAGAAAFVTRDPDLRLIGRAAERWRRTMAGHWTYGRAPAGWRGRMLDVAVSQRIEDLLAEPDPWNASIEYLGIWSADGGTALAADLRWRLHATLASAEDRHAGGVEAVAAQLLHRYVPTAFVPALAVMSHMGPAP